MPSPRLPGFAARLLPPTPMSRRLATQSILFSSGEGTFLTVSAAFFLYVAGLSPAQVGLALTIGGVAEFLVAYPAGRLVDHVGPKRMWALTALGQALSFAALPLITEFWQYVALTIFLGTMEAAGSAGRNAYVLDILSPEERVRTQAYMYSSLNVGFTLGAGLGAIALVFPGEGPLRWVPVFTAAMLAANAYWITRLPKASHDLRAADKSTPIVHTGPGPLRNRGWMFVSFFAGTMWTNQVLLHTVIPLWLVDATDAPKWVLAWLFATNTVLCIFLPPYTARFVRDLRTAIRCVWVSTAFFVAACVITMATHSTEGLLTIFLVWLGHVAVTGAELFISASSWSFQAELMEPARRGEYQGVQDVFGALGSRWAPALFTFLALEWGNEGWLVIAGIIVAAAAGLGPAVRSAERFAAQHFPATRETPEQLLADPAVTAGTDVGIGEAAVPAPPPAAELS